MRIYRQRNCKITGNGTTLKICLKTINISFKETTSITQSLNWETIELILILIGMVGISDHTLNHIIIM